MKAARSFKWLICGQIFVAIVWAIDISLRPYLIKVILDTIAETPHTHVVEHLLHLGVQISGVARKRRSCQ